MSEPDPDELATILEVADEGNVTRSVAVLAVAVRSLRAENEQLRPEIVCMSCEGLTGNVDCVCDGCKLGDQAEEIDTLKAERDRAVAALQRVEAVIDKWYTARGFAGIADLLRAAIKGEDEQ